MKEKNNNEKSLKNIIIAIVFLIWFFCSFFAMIIFPTINTYYSIMIFGQYLLVFGIIALVSKGKGKMIGLPFLLVGVACIIIPFLMIHPELLNITINWEKIIIILVLLFFIGTGLSMIFIPVSRFYNLKKMCTITVSATVSENEIVLSDEGNKLYCPIYNFTFNSKNYEITKNVYTNIEKYPKGTIVQLKINPNNPNEFLDDSTISKFIIILGILFLIVSLPVLFYVIV